MKKKFGLTILVSALLASWVYSTPSWAETTSTIVLKKVTTVYQRSKNAGLNDLVIMGIGTVGSNNTESPREIRIENANLNDGNKKGILDTCYKMAMLSLSSPGKYRMGIQVEGNYLGNIISIDINQADFILCDFSPTSN